MIIKKYTNLDKKRPESGNISTKIYKEQQLRTLKDYGDFRDALELAESTDTPDRFDLIGAYKDFDLDCHITGIKNALKNKIKAREFGLYKGDKLDEEATKLLESEWFFDFIDIIMDAFFFGYTLAQFGNIKNNAFESVKSVPREYIVPEWKLLKKYASTTTESDGIKFLENPKYNKWLIWYDTGTMGLFANTAIHTIAKKHLLILALEKAEMFGIPMRIGYTDIFNPKLRNEMEAMLDNMGSAAWAVLHEGQRVDLIENKQGDIYKIFTEPMKLCNQEISKALAGQTMVFEDGSSYSQSKVHENLFEEFVGQYMKALSFIVNNQSIPFMVSHTLLSEGYTFMWNDIEKLSKIERVDLIVKLSQYYEITPEEVEKYTGVPIEDIKMSSAENISDHYKNILKK